MNIRKHNYSVIVIISLVFFSFPRMLLSVESPRRLLSGEEKVATVSKIEGRVEVEHKAVWKSLTKADNNTINYSIYDDDTVFTRSSSMADLVFDDNSQVKIKEDTILSFSTKQKSKSTQFQSHIINNPEATQKEIVNIIKLQTGELWANITSAKSGITGFETPAGIVSVDDAIFSLIYNGYKATLKVLKGQVAFNSKGDEIFFEIESGEKVNIFYPGGGRASLEVKTGVVDVLTKFGNVLVEAGESVGVSEDAVTSEVSIIAEEGIIEHETNAGTVKIRESGAITVREEPMTGRIMVTDTDNGINMTKNDGTTTKVVAGSSIGTLTEIDTPAEYAALTPSEDVSMGDIDADKNIEHKKNPVASSSKHESSTPPSTDYLLDFAKKIMVADTNDDTTEDVTVTKVPVSNSTEELAESNAPAVTVLSHGEEIGQGIIDSAPNEVPDISVDKGNINAENAIDNDRVPHSGVTPKKIWQKVRRMPKQPLLRHQTQQIAIQCLQPWDPVIIRSTTRQSQITRFQHKRILIILNPLITIQLRQTSVCQAHLKAQIIYSTLQEKYKISR